MSTTSRSPGWAPSTSIGPDSMCARVRSTSRTSLAESLLPIWASVHSRHSTRNSLPGTDTDGGRDVGVPAVVAGHGLVGIDLDLVDREHYLGHEYLTF